MKNRGTGEIFRRGNIWWISYHVAGKRFRESSKSDLRKKAVKLLRLRTGWVAQGHQPMPDTSRTTFEDLKDGLLDDYRMNRRKSLDRAEISMANLGERFGHWKAENITSDAITKYAVERQRQGRKNATINRELAALARSFRLALDARKVAEIPKISLLKENNTRRGFLELDGYARLANECAKTGLWLRALLETAYTFGFRLGELRSMRCRQVNLFTGTISLETSKNGEPREVYMTAGVRELLTALIVGKT